MSVTLNDSHLSFDQDIVLFRTCSSPFDDSAKSFYNWKLLTFSKVVNLSKVS